MSATLSKRSIGNITTVASAVVNQKKAAYFSLAVSSLATVAILPINCHGRNILGKVYLSQLYTKLFLFHLGNQQASQLLDYAAEKLLIIFIVLLHFIAYISYGIDQVVEAEMVGMLCNILESSRDDPINNLAVASTKTKGNLFADLS